MQEILLENYKNLMDEFIKMSETNKLEGFFDKIDSSTGKSIAGINKCVKEYKNYCDNINEIYLATAYYLQKAYNNIESCEETI